jgi:hypothetical protein
MYADGMDYVFSIGNDGTLTRLDEKPAIKKDDEWFEHEFLSDAMIITHNTPPIDLSNLKDNN